MLTLEFLKMPAETTVDILDVGQGDAILLTTAEGNRILVDGGPGLKVLEELGEIMPFFWNRIDLVVLTHPHADHIDGLVPVLERFDVAAVLLTGVDYQNLAYGTLLEEIDAQEIPFYFAEADRDFTFGSLYLDVLYPFKQMNGVIFENVNNSSIVMKVYGGGKSILLTGDAEVQVEEWLLAEDSEGADLKSDYLKAGHHGSKTAGSLEFLKAVQPLVMLISAGVDNSFSHPHEETLEKADDLDIEVKRTDTDGRIRIFLE